MSIGARPQTRNYTAIDYYYKLLSANIYKVE